MARLLTAKVGQYALVLLIALALNFLLPRFMGGDPLQFIVGEDIGRLTPAERDKIRVEYGLDLPLYAQFGNYLGDMAQGDLGWSISKKAPIGDVLKQRIPITLLLTGTALVLSTIIGVALGALAAWRRGRRSDLSILTVFMFLESMPAFWVGMLLVAIFAVNLRLLPIFGFETPYVRYEGMAKVGDIAKHLVLPVTTLTIVSVSAMFLTARYSMLTVLGEDYITVARAKGIHERWVLFRHALRNALLPVATLFMLRVGFVFSGAVVVETVFSYPGLGRLIFEAVVARDYPLLQAGFIIATFTVVAANVLVEFVYPLLDPRVRVHG
jgi:peptide/nickel transport system permease protein